MVKAVVGANWGDEGKGKITDMMAEKADIIVRFQGGANAGHTIVNNYGKFALHTLPSGIFYQHTVSIIGNGVALNIPVLMKELKSITDRNVPAPRLLISDRAQIVMPYHILFDQYEEERLGKNSFGSTKSGIAPFYSDKYAKIGFQVNELFDDELLKEKVYRVLETKNILLEHLYHKDPINPEELLATLREYREMVAPYVCDVSAYLDKAIKEGKTILLEGQLGTLKDPDHGIYPMVTSSSTLAAYGAIGAGLPPYEIKEIVTVCKAYSSAVGAGAFVSEIFGDEADELRRRGGDGGEYGATTGRPRRMGWFDCNHTYFYFGKITHNIILLVFAEQKSEPHARRGFILLVFFYYSLIFVITYRLKFSPLRPKKEPSGSPPSAWPINHLLTAASRASSLGALPFSTLAWVVFNS